MITVEQIKDWSNERARRELSERIEAFIDNEIKEQLLGGHKDFIKISTGYHGRDTHYKSDFYELWCNDNMSQTSLMKVRNEIIEKYEAIGLEVISRDYDEGWHSRYPGLEIRIPQELLES